MNKHIYIGLICLFFACKQKNKPTTITDIENTTITAKKSTPFTANIESAHNKTTFLQKKAISYNIDINFGGQKHLEGTITHLTDGTKIRIDKADGSKIIFDGNKVVASPSETANPAARFDIFTWQYFLSLPYKLNDPGTIWSKSTTNKWGSQTYDTSRLSFKPNIGDAPKDWYVIYKDPTTHLLKGAAYIVSFGKTLAEAEKEPHAVKFEKFTTIKGVPVATQWTFHNWNITDGYTNQIGNVTLKNIHFLNNTEGLFSIPEYSKTVEAPGY